MKAVRVRVRNFRNIDDSGWIALERVTAFVGRNESGKTSLLKALHKFNPAAPEPYDAQREFPRDRYTRDYIAKGSNGADWPVCSIEFEITPELRDRIGPLLGGSREPPVSVTLTRSYDGSLAFEYAPALALDEQPLAPGPIRRTLQAFASGIRQREGPAEDERPSIAVSQGHLADWAAEWSNRLEQVDDLRSVQGLRLLRNLCTEATERGGPQADDMVETLLAAVDPVLDAAQAGSSLDQINALVERNLPVLIYFENYGVIDSSIWLPQFLEDLDRDAFDPRVRTVGAMFKHVGLDPKEVAELGRERAHMLSGPDPERIADDRRRKEERAIQLNSASLDISRRFSAWWSQRRHRIRYHADGDYFRIWVADDRRTDVEIELEARSKGFQWFFSFYLVFLVESEAGHKNAILLLDEPGLHLHPTAQRGLISFLETLSEKNQVAYTTHSPFLIDGEHLHRVRLLAEDDSGHSSIAAETWPSDPETIFTLQAAAGYAMIRGLFQHRKTVLVEGMSDFYYLQTLSQQCARTGRPALPDDVHVTPSGGIRNVSQIASLFLAHDIRPLVLLDGEDARRVQHDALAREFYARHGRDIVMLDAVLNRPGQDVAIEDILGERIVLPALEAVLAKPFVLADGADSAASLTSRIAEAAKHQALPGGWRASAALHLVSSWAKDGTVLDDGVLDLAAGVFSALLERFDEVPVPGDQFDAEVSEHAVEDDEDLLGLLLDVVGNDQASVSEGGVEGPLEAAASEEQ